MGSDQDLDIGHWTPIRARVDEAYFSAGRFGPYRLGSHLRQTAIGSVTLALHDKLDEVVELDAFEALRHSPLKGLAEHVLGDLGQVAAIMHPHVAPLLGAGIEAGRVAERSGADMRAQLEGAASPADLARSLRRAHRDPCGHRREHVGATLREHFNEAIQRDRAFFGLSSLH